MIFCVYDMVIFEMLQARVVKNDNVDGDDEYVVSQ